MAWGRRATCGGRRTRAPHRRGTAMQRGERTTRPVWWTAWSAGTSPAASTTVSSPARAAKASSRGASAATSATPAGKRRYHSPKGWWAPTLHMKYGSMICLKTLDAIVLAICRPSIMLHEQRFVYICFAQRNLFLLNYINTMVTQNTHRN